MADNHANQTKFNEAGGIQHKTMDALDRIKRDVEETKEMGTETLEHLKKHDGEMVSNLQPSY